MFLGQGIWPSTETSYIPRWHSRFNAFSRVKLDTFHRLFLTKFPSEDPHVSWLVSPWHCSAMLLFYTDHDVVTFQSRATTTQQEIVFYLYDWSRFSRVDIKIKLSTNNSPTDVPLYPNNDWERDIEPWYAEVESSCTGLGPAALLWLRMLCLSMFQAHCRCPTSTIILIDS